MFCRSKFKCLIVYELFVFMYVDGYAVCHFKLCNVPYNFQNKIFFNLFYVYIFLQVANAMVATWAGPPAMLAIFRKLFGSASCRRIIKQNNFSNFQHYFLQKVNTLFIALKSFSDILSLTFQTTCCRLYQLQWQDCAMLMVSVHRKS